MFSFVRANLLLGSMCLAACQSGSMSVQQPSPAATHLQMFETAVMGIGPIASDMCQKQNPTEPDTFCDFDFELNGSALGRREATLSRDTNGQPIVRMSHAMLNAAANVDEVAYVLAHETGHQIADHLGTIKGFQPISGTNGFTLHRHDTKFLELEADVIAMLIVDQAGFSPDRGLDAITRFGGAVGYESATHPEVSRRLEVAQRTVDVIQSGQEITLN